MSIKIVKNITNNTGGGGSGVSEHDKLTNRELAEQHPIESIAGLSNELSKKYEKPLSGIPAPDLEDVYVKKNDFDTLNNNVNTLNNAGTDIITRISSLENKTMNMLQQTKDTFDNFNNIDLTKTTAVVSKNKITIGKRKVITDLFDDTSIMDIANSYNVNISNGQLQLDSGVQEGVFVSSEFTTEGTNAVQISGSEMKPSDGAFSLVESYGSVKYISKSIVARDGKLWTFYIDTSSTYPSIFVRVLNSDNTEFIPFTKTSIVIGGNSNSYITVITSFHFKLAVDYDNNIWISCPYNSGGNMYAKLTRISANTTDVLQIAVSPTSITGGYLGDVIVDSNNKIWWVYNLYNATTALYYQAFNSDGTSYVVKTALGSNLSNLLGCKLATTEDERTFVINFQTGTTGVSIYELKPSGCTRMFITTTITVSNLSSVIYSSSDKCLYIASLVSSSKIQIFKFNCASTTADSWTKILLCEFPVANATSTYSVYSRIEILQDKDYSNIYHVVFVSYNESSSYLNSHYISFNSQTGTIIKNDIAINPSTSFATNVFDIYYWNNDLRVNVQGSSSLSILKFAQVPTNIQYFVSNDGGSNYYEVTNGDIYNFADSDTKLRLKIKMTSPTIYTTPLLSSYVMQEWNTGMSAPTVTKEFITNTLPTIQIAGKCKISASQDIKDGTVNWYMSSDDGTTWFGITLNNEFDFTEFIASNIRLKAILTLPGVGIYAPEIYSYTITTSAIVLHSDLEIMQINMMKTNFKIDSYTNATKNGLIKMTIDVFSDISGIDASKSSYNFDNTLKSVSNGIIVSSPDTITNATTALLVTADEILNTGSINYYYTRDEGVTWKPVALNVQNNISGTGAALRLKAEITGDAKLNAWAWAWN